MCRFSYGKFTFELSAGYPPVCDEHEKDKNFQVTLKDSGRLPLNLRPTQLKSWILGRLAALTFGSIQSEHGGAFANDGGEFAYRFKVSAKDYGLAGKFGIVFYQERIEFAGFSSASANMKDLFIEILLSEPNDVDACEIQVADPETGRKRTYGWDGHQYLV